MEIFVQYKGEELEFSGAKQATMQNNLFDNNKEDFLLLSFPANLFNKQVYDKLVNETKHITMQLRNSQGEELYDFQELRFRFGILDIDGESFRVELYIL